MLIGPRPMAGVELCRIGKKALAHRRIVDRLRVLLRELLQVGVEPLRQARIVGILGVLLLEADDVGFEIAAGERVLILADRGCGYSP